VLKLSEKSQGEGSGATGGQIEAPRECGVGMGLVKKMGEERKTASFHRERR